jgi:hypothetical protein
MRWKWPLNQKHRPAQSSAELRGMASILVAPGIASYQKPTRQRRRKGVEQAAHSSIARIPYFKVLAFGLVCVYGSSGAAFALNSISAILSMDGQRRNDGGSNFGSRCEEWRLRGNVTKSDLSLWVRYEIFITASPAARILRDVGSRRRMVERH